MLQQFPYTHVQWLSTVKTCNFNFILFSISGTIFRLKGCILTMSFLDCNGALIPYSYEAWKDENKEGRERISKDAVAQSMYIWSFSSESYITLPLNISNNLKLRLTDDLHMVILCLYCILNLVCVIWKWIGDLFIICLLK